MVVRVTSSAEYIVNEIKRHKRGVLLTVVALSLIVFATLTFVVNRDHPIESIESIAVLPFVTQNDDPQAGSDAAALGDAITDSIINNLSQLPNLDVRPRGAVLRYKDREVDPQEVAKDLDVHAVLTGRIIRRGDSLQVSVALVDTRENRNLWGEQYNRKISDLLLIQQEIASSVSDNLRLKLSGQEKRRLEAQQLYLKGRNAWSKRTADDIQEGAKFLEQAIEVDPNYAPAYAGLADCYSMLVNYSVLPGSEAFPKAKEAAEKAMELDENLAEAHAARAFIYFLWEWNWAEAGREYRRAIQLEPQLQRGPSMVFQPACRDRTNRRGARRGETRRASSNRFRRSSALIRPGSTTSRETPRAPSGRPGRRSNSIRTSSPRGAIWRWATIYKANTTTPSPSFKKPLRSRPEARWSGPNSDTHTPKRAGARKPCG